MPDRVLMVVADDYGIGRETSRGILKLLHAGVVTGTVLLVNAPGVDHDVAAWNDAGRPGAMGWHPNLNLDAPISASSQISTLIDGKGNFATLGRLMLRLATGQVCYRELVIELLAQLQRFHDLVGAPPTLVNGHKHIHVFPMIRDALAAVLRRYGLRPYVRRITEPRTCLWNIPGARLKRLFLTTLGNRASVDFDREGFPGNDTLAGITDPKWVSDPAFFARWLARVPGRVVELAVHPGHRDESLIGRDCTAHDGQLERRVAEWNLLSAPEFMVACRQAGFTLQSAATMYSPHERNGYLHVAA